jgi:hypothetical protein
LLSWLVNFFMDAAAIKKRKRGRDGQGKELSRQEEVI